MGHKYLQDRNPVQVILSLPPFFYSTSTTIMSVASFSSTLSASPVLPARAAQPIAQRKAVKVNAVFTKNKPGAVKPNTIGAKKNITKKAAPNKALSKSSKNDGGNWTLARTLSEKKLGEVGDNLGKRCSVWWFH